MPSLAELEALREKLHQQTGAPIPSNESDARSGSEFLFRAALAAAVRPQGYRPVRMRSHPEVIETGVERLDEVADSPTTTDWRIRTFGSADAGDGGFSSDFEKDFTNIRSGLLQTGETEEYSIKLTKPANPANGRLTTQIEKYLSPENVDWTEGDADSALYAWLRFYVSADMLTEVDEIYFETYQNTGGVGLRKLFELRRDGNGDAESSPGWYETQIRIPTDERYGYDEVDRVRFQANFINDGAVGALTLDRFAMRRAPNAAKAMVLRDDDGYLSAYPRAKWLAAWNLPCSFAVHGAITGTTGYMTVSQLRELQDQGHAIVSHGWNKFINDDTTGEVRSLFDMDETEFRLHLTKNIDWMYANGFEEGALTWVVHQGNLTTAMVEIARSLGIKMVSNTSGFRLNGSAEDIHNFAQPADGITWHGMDVTNGYNNVSKTFTGSGMWAELDTEKLRPGDVVIPYGHGLNLLTDSNNDRDDNRIERIIEAMEDTTYGGVKAKAMTLIDIANGLHWKE